MPETRARSLSNKPQPPPPVLRRPFGAAAREPQAENIYALGARTKLGYQIEDVSRLVYKMKFIRAEERAQEYGLSNDKFKRAIISAVVWGISNCTPWSLRRARKISGFYGLDEEKLKRLAGNRALFAISKKKYSCAQKICKTFGLPLLLDKARFEMIKNKILLGSYRSAERDGRKHGFSSKVFRSAALLAIEEDIRNGNYFGAAMSSSKYGFAGQLGNASKLLVCHEFHNGRPFDALLMARRFNPCLTDNVLLLISESFFWERQSRASILARLDGRKLQNP